MVALVVSVGEVEAVVHTEPDEDGDADRLHHAELPLLDQYLVRETDKEERKGGLRKERIARSGDADMRL